jgi:hypothetical protein
LAVRRSSSYSLASSSTSIPPAEEGGRSSSLAVKCAKGWIGSGGLSRAQVTELEMGGHQSTVLNGEEEFESAAKGCAGDRANIQRRHLRKMLLPNMDMLADDLILSYLSCL